MRRGLVAFAALAFPLLLGGCSTGFGPEDRATLQQAQSDAREAKAEAARANATAQQAAADAKAANEKADRMFVRSQRKVR